MTYKDADHISYQDLENICLQMKAYAEKIGWWRIRVNFQTEIKDGEFERYFMFTGYEDKTLVDGQHYEFVRPPKTWREDQDPKGPYAPAGPRVEFEVWLDDVLAQFKRQLPVPIDRTVNRIQEKLGEAAELAKKAGLNGEFEEDFDAILAKIKDKMRQLSENAVTGPQP